LGLSYFENGEFEEAIPFYTKAINLELQNSNDIGFSREYLSLYYNNRGLAYYHFRETDSALRDYNEAIKAVNGTNAENFFNRGNVYLHKEEF